VSDILFERVGGLGLITLNRPRAMNALTHDMALMLEERLLHWRDDAAVAAVAIMGAGERAFCAGGDVRALWEAGKDDPAAHGPRNFQFYDDEYRLNALIFNYPKPYLALMDGVTMGGGVGVSIHGSRRVAGDRTVFAMPEAGIGLFPDVGGTYFLPRMPGRTGLWLALTGARLGPADCLGAGVCDVYVPSDRHGALLQALADAPLQHDPLAAIDATLHRFATDPQGGTLSARWRAIDACFAAAGVAEVLAALDAYRGPDRDWAAEQAAAIRMKSPTSLTIAARQIAAGGAMEFAACMAAEARLARFCMTHPDFYEGVRAVIIDKTGDPAWRPATLDAVHAAAIDAAFVG
jgi:enoyl-CoA hydratase